jgi:hypothetical protein
MKLPVELAYTGNQASVDATRPGLNRSLTFHLQVP